MEEKREGLHRLQAAKEEDACCTDRQTDRQFGKRDRYTIPCLFSSFAAEFFFQYSFFSSSRLLLLLHLMIMMMTGR